MRDISDEIFTTYLLGIINTINKKIITKIICQREN